MLRIRTRIRKFLTFCASWISWRSLWETFVWQVHDQPFYGQVHDVIAECSRYSLDVQAREAIQLTVNFFILITSMKIYKTSYFSLNYIIIIKFFSPVWLNFLHGLVLKAVFQIHIYLIRIRIRIQHFRHFRIQIQGFDDRKFEQKLQLKNYFFWDQKLQFTYH